MASYSFILHFPIITLFFFLLTIVESNGDYDTTQCSIPYSCGSLKNVTYPFWGVNRPMFCGISAFKLSCLNDSGFSTRMNIFSDEHPSTRVLSINTSSHKLVLEHNLDWSEHYHTNHNTTLLPFLKPDVGYTSISLLCGCNNSCSRYYKSFNCTNFCVSNSTTVYYSDEHSDISRTDKSCSCESNRTYVVNKRALSELGKNVSFTMLLKKWPKFGLKIVLNFTACSMCEDSGGSCGSKIDTIPDRFLCYCQDGQQPLPCHTIREKKIGIYLGLGIGGGTVILVAIIAICYLRKMKLGCFASSPSDLERESRHFGLPLFSYSELVAATRSFDQSNELGSGGFGTVYYGKLKDGREVAVKRLFEKSYGRVQHFMNEVKILTKLRHQNLVSLYGCTSLNSIELILVYEYVKNGTVADHLFGKFSKSGLLPWSVRLKIAIETATALSYLHASEIVHRDVKTNNILLDSNFSVKVADFGLSRLFPTDVTHVLTAPQGTPGYLDPEYHLCYKLTDKSDVYSFGVVLIELISSMPAINMDREKLEINLSNYAMSRIQRCEFDELVDRELGFAKDFKVRRMTISVAELAFQCLQHDNEFRPSMNEVLENLKRIECVDYEALQAEEMAKNGGEEMVKMHRNKVPPRSPTEDDQAQLLSNHQLYPPSPISLMDKCFSMSTASNNSK
ncbi:LEAF RUST 10 DISEASE-RESISTANCE LOCUS RECEPTOR-LIKE PROTEIN KINASE-like 1.1 [Amaranthus tricolor]|uniref:LEAF RUST 10 DISEASE-RESISTANCE LOCUS RECEPTOR-LIKE PROTEIN KINASE-like 1.1 n=1 Tax=Amaranthus tricolor TaxID=29722 RepID=UPI0025854C84|nr:LEAF RUST 10 DISEASE-RESISTANCE LOCUS RECEPTOR-LIKE PROTEIN KINASE-like 1.1 [Amaranthus tricolor]